MKGQDEPYAPQAPPPYGDNVPPAQAYAPPGGHTTIVTQPVQVVHVQSFGPDPIQMPCPHCHATIVTSTRPVSGTLTWLVAGGLCLLGCWIGCCLIPFCVDGCQNIEHQCPNCKALVGTYRRL